MINGVTFVQKFVDNPESLYAFLKDAVNWDESMAARRTASYGKAYNYSQMQYPSRPFLAELKQLGDAIDHLLGFLPNNCLINYYPDGKSKMGFHSDQTDILEAGTGVAIVSLGATRTLKGRNIADSVRVGSA